MKITTSNNNIYINGEYRGYLDINHDQLTMHIRLRSVSKVNRFLKFSIDSTDAVLAKNIKKELFKVLTH